MSCSIITEERLNIDWDEVGNVRLRKRLKTAGGKVDGEPDFLLSFYFPHFHSFSSSDLTSVVDVGEGGGCQVLVPTQFLSDMKKNGFLFPFLPYPTSPGLTVPRVCVSV